MEVKTKRIIIGCLTILIIIVMIIFVDYKTIFNNLKEISLLGIFLFCLTYTIAFIFRTYKLKLVFRGINLDPKFYTIYGAIGTGWAINELTPAKIGDLAKIEFIHQKEANLHLSKCACAVLIERFIDFIILFSITCFTLILIYISEITYTTDLNIQFFILIGSVIILGGFIALLVLFFRTEAVLNVLEKISPKFRIFIENFLRRFVEGMKDFRNDKKRILWVFLLNIPTWFFESLTLVILFFLAGFNINFLIIILAQILTFFTKTIPITPGGWGISEIAGAILISIFYPLTISFENILSIFILDHILRIIYVFIYGGISTISINFKYRKLDIKRLEENENLD
ncbi:MAG TPA: flippase-like domain-containing protein [archaeon]|nr:flippase-like domain-containing protein [archaeon]